MIYDIAIIGYGITGMLSLAILQQQQYNMCIIDPYFDGGNLMRLYGDVLSNTPLSKTINGLKRIDPNYILPEKYQIYDIDKITPLSVIAQIIKDFTNNYKKQVDIYETKVISLKYNNIWDIQTYEDIIQSKMIIMCQGAEAKRLKKEVFREYEIGVLHSKMSKQKKEEVMALFTRGAINILCATSVVEVGVNVPNATIIIIEGAERFGLAQLHQLRGRVIRSNHQAYCYVFADAKTDKTIQRLKALKTAKNGFELAELDLSLRGAGELGGTKQWGITDLGMEAIKNIKMVEAARTEAVRLISIDPELSKYPLLKAKVKEKNLEFHFE